MDHSHAEMKLPWLSAQIRRQVQGRRLKVYVERLDTNFNLTNLGGKRLSLALKFSLSQRGIIMGWKKGAEVWPHDVHILQLDLMLLVNEAQFNRDWIEMQLAHADSTVRGAYNAAEWLSGRRKMLEWWSDYVEARRI